jgi:hypothetical protein
MIFRAISSMAIGGAFFFFPASSSSSSPDAGGSLSIRLSSAYAAGRSRRRAPGISIHGRTSSRYAM